MKKIYLHRFLKFSALVIPIALIVIFLQSTLCTYLDHNAERIRKFYCEEENSLDVVILGSSEVHSGYSPGYAYGQYGYTSYMYTIDANPGSLYLSQLKEVLSRQSPQLILVEVFGYTMPAESQNNEAKLRCFTENIPASNNKLDTIMQFNYDDKVSCLFPFLKYHGDLRLARRHALYYCRNYNTMDAPALSKGMVTSTTVYNGPGDGNSTEQSDYQINDTCKGYLVDFLEYCQQNGLDNVVFVNFPRCFQDESGNDCLARVDDIREIVEEYGFEFLNLQDKKDLIGLDMQKDFYDPHHMNIYGMQKLTDYLGSLVMNEYHVTPVEQSSENIAHWQACVSHHEEHFAFAHEKISKGHTVWVDGVTDFLM